MLCNTELWNGLDHRLDFENGIELKKALSECDIYRKKAMLYAAKHDCRENVLCYAIEYNEWLDIITKIAYFKDTFVTSDEILDLYKRCPNTEFGILYANSNENKELCQKALDEEKSKYIRPITLKEANAFVIANHRHHDSVTGCKFAIGLNKVIDGVDTLIGVAICGRPVSRHLDDGLTLEINRLCVTEAGNSCSMLYGACSRIARDMGYKKIITYILQSESGISLKASNFILEDEECGGKNWSGTRKRKHNTVPEELKQRWSKILIV